MPYTLICPHIHCPETVFHGCCHVASRDIKDHISCAESGFLQATIFQPITLVFLGDSNL